ncbi:MAG TPA: neutral zinc metallopeptidase [Vicinamibacterales bacterium]
MRRVLVATIAVLVLGADFSESQSTSRANLDPQLRALLDSARADIDRYWRSRVRNYQAPVDVVIIQAPAQTDCGRVDGPNAIYCPSTHKIYWDVAFMTAQRKFGDFAPVYVLAHEWGHLVQRLLGFANANVGLASIQLELQADCFAGEWAADAKKRGLLDPGDDDEAVMSLRRSGDRIDDPWFDPRAHGTAGLRIDAFLYGFDPRSCADSQFFEYLQRRGVDPSRIQQQPAPTNGSLAGQLPRAAGRFALVSVKREPTVGATDGLAALYRTRDGVTVSHVLSAFRSAADADAIFNSTVNEVLAQQFKQIKREWVVDPQGQRIGKLILLQGQGEVVVWTNGSLMALAVGPRDATWEFYTALPY